MASSALDNFRRMLMCFVLLSHFSTGGAVNDVTCETAPSTAVSCPFSDDFCQWRHENLTISLDFTTYAMLDGNALTGRLESKLVCGHFNEYCFHFQYRLFTNNQLTVQVVQSSGANTAIWQKTTPATDSNFQSVYIPVSYSDDYQLVIVFHRSLLPIEGPYLRFASVLSFAACPLDPNRPTPQNPLNFTDAENLQTTSPTAAVATTAVLTPTFTPPSPTIAATTIPTPTTGSTTKHPPTSTSNPQTANRQSALTSSLASSTSTPKQPNDDVTAMMSHTTSRTRTSVSFVPPSPSAGFTPPLAVLTSSRVSTSSEKSTSSDSENILTATDDSSQIPVGMIAGVASAVVAVVLVAVIIVIVCRRRGLLLWKSGLSPAMRDSNSVEKIVDQNMLMTAVRSTSAVKNSSYVNADRRLSQLGDTELGILSTTHDNTNDCQHNNASPNKIKTNTPTPPGVEDEEQTTGASRLSNPYDIISTCDPSSTLHRQEGYYYVGGSQYYTTKAGQDTLGSGQRRFGNTGPLFENGQELRDRFQPGSLEQGAANGHNYTEAVQAEGGKPGHGNIRPDGNRPNETAVDESQIYASIPEDAIADDLGRLDPSCYENKGEEYGQCQMEPYSTLERYQATEDVHDYYSLAQPKI